MKGLLDNDILIKGSCYGLASGLEKAIPGNGRCGILGAAKYVAPEVVRGLGLKSAAKALASLVGFLEQCSVVEPDEYERRLAASLESHAQRLALNLDAGESQLVAILLHRTLPFLATGDKRAIASLERLIDVDSQFAAVTGRVLCLEQVVLRLVSSLGEATLRIAICSEPGVDKTMTICFACHSVKPADGAIPECLHSYLNDLRVQAPRALATI